MKNVLALLLLVSMLFSCQEERDIRGYYFPMKYLTKGVVYEYQSVGKDSFPPAYWYYRSFINSDSVFLTGTKYDARLYPEQFIREEMVGNGMLTVENFIYESDTFGRQLQVPVQVIAGDVYPFFVKPDGGVFVHQTKWNSRLQPDLSYEIVKNRKFLRDTTFTFQKREYPAIVMQVREALDQRQEGTLSLESIGEEIYAKDLGLVAFEKRFSNGLTLSFELRIRYGMDVLEHKFMSLHGDPDLVFDHFMMNDHIRSTQE